MTVRSTLGAVLIAVPVLGVLAFAGQAMAQQHGWKTTAAVFAAAVAGAASIGSGMYLLG